MKKLKAKFIAVAVAAGAIAGLIAGISAAMFIKTHPCKSFCGMVKRDVKHAFKNIEDNIKKV